MLVLLKYNVTRFFFYIWTIICCIFIIKMFFPRKSRLQSSSAFLPKNYSCRGVQATLAREKNFYVGGFYDTDSNHIFYQKNKYKKHGETFLDFDRWTRSYQRTSVHFLFSGVFQNMRPTDLVRGKSVATSHDNYQSDVEDCE